MTDTCSLHNSVPLVPVSLLFLLLLSLKFSHYVATHIRPDCEAIAYLRFRHLGLFFMEPSDYYEAPINKVLHFIRSVGLIKERVNQKENNNRSLKVAVQGPDYWGPLLVHSFIHITWNEANKILRDFQNHGKFQQVS
jgi:hypothetical protein